MKKSQRSCFVVLVAAVAVLVGCVETPERSAVRVSDGVSPEGEALIYGSDDRREVFELSDATLLALADSTVAVLSTSDVFNLGNGSFGLNVSTSYGARYGLCNSEPYRTQPSTADCSGFMVGEDLIATAGHCVDGFSCGSTAFVFGFRMLDASTVRSTVPADDVYTCAQVIGRAETSTDDWAVVRVDRPIVGHSPLEIRRSGSASLGDPLAVSGHPAGIPLKVAGGATVRGNSQANYFEANLDTYGGNSGSPVINTATGVVEGVLVRGNTDFVSVGKGRRRCNVSNECSDNGCPGFEDVSRTTRFDHLVPEIVTEPCTSDAECDDNNACNGAETCDLNSGDCAAGTALDCNDSDACTQDSCDPASGCTHSGLSCNDGNACTVDFCDSVDGCGSTPVACDNGADGCCSPGCDGVDPDCDVPQCSPKNAPCSSNADCCSGTCHHRKRTCR